MDNEVGANFDRGPPLCGLADALGLAEGVGGTGRRRLKSKVCVEAVACRHDLYQHGAGTQLVVKTRVTVVADLVPNVARGVTIPVRLWECVVLWWAAC